MGISGMLLSLGFFLRFYLPLSCFGGEGLMSFIGAEAGSECRMEFDFTGAGLLIGY